MGYTTYFSGGFSFNKPCDPFLKEYLNAFAEVSHMKRDVNEIRTLDPQWNEHCFRGNLGEEGAFYIKKESDNFRDCVEDKTIIDLNTPPKGCPGLWCQWIVEEDQLVWDEGEKFYNYVEWLKFLIKYFIGPSGYVLNGSVEYEGEEPSDDALVSEYIRRDLEYKRLSNFLFQSLDEIDWDFDKRGRRQARAIFSAICVLYQQNSEVKNETLNEILLKAYEIVRSKSSMSYYEFMRYMFKNVV